MGISDFFGPSRKDLQKQLDDAIEPQINQAYDKAFEAHQNMTRLILEYQKLGEKVEYIKLEQAKMAKTFGPIAEKYEQGRMLPKNEEKIANEWRILLNNSGIFERKNRAIQNQNNLYLRLFDTHHPKYTKAIQKYNSYGKKMKFYHLYQWLEGVPKNRFGVLLLGIAGAIYAARTATKSENA